MQVILLIGIVMAGIVISILARKISECETSLDDNFQNKKFAKFINTLGETTKKKAQSSKEETM